MSQFLYLKNSNNILLLKKMTVYITCSLNVTKLVCESVYETFTVAPSVLDEKCADSLSKVSAVFMCLLLVTNDGTSINLCYFGCG
jgi:hypothetical protein